VRSVRRANVLCLGRPAPRPVGRRRPSPARGAARASDQAGGPDVAYATGAMALDAEGLREIVVGRLGAGKLIAVSNR
jgi:hypothetical protein